MAPAAGAVPPTRSARHALAVLFGLLATAVAFWFLRAQPPSTPAPDVPAMSMVVLPLAVEGDAKATEWFADACSAT